MDGDEVLARIQVQCATRALRVTDHAREEMEEETNEMQRNGLSR
jgi:hypothetical protein